MTVRINEARCLTFIRNFTVFEQGIANDGLVSSDIAALATEPFLRLVEIAASRLKCLLAQHHAYLSLLSKLVDLINGYHKFIPLIVNSRL